MVYGHLEKTVTALVLSLSITDSLWGETRCIYNCVGERLHAILSVSLGSQATHSFSEFLNFLSIYIIQSFLQYMIYLKRKITLAGN